mmetsp:Transcript_5042/g.14008  ORF Transcript_5042/g.14008 Transcript_5042/m.14008 type:complete len:83 (+) Transcript_5042:659-907(+)
MLASAVLARPGLLATMSCMRHGHFASEAVLRIACSIGDCGDFEQACLQLAEGSVRLEGSRFGRSVLSVLRQLQSASTSSALL